MRATSARGMTMVAPSWRTIRSSPDSSQESASIEPPLLRWMTSAASGATVDGFTILVGRTSTDNEKVTFRAAGPNDLWLHARDYPGSHVIILTEKRHVPDKVLYTAAALAAEASGARNDIAPEIMVTERKWVRKLKGGKPGQVTVERFRTIRPRSHNQKKKVQRPKGN